MSKELSTIKEFVVSAFSFLFSLETVAVFVGILVGFLVTYFILWFFSKKDSSPVIKLGIKNLAQFQGFHWKEVFEIEIWPTLKIDQPTKLEYFWGWLYLPLRIKYIKYLKIFVVSIFLFTLLIATIYKSSLVIFLFSLIIFLTVIFLWNRFHKNRRKFIDQIPDGLTRLIEALQSGYSLPQAISFLSNELRAPLKNIFSTLSRASEFGIPLEEILSKTEEQININEWSMIVKGLSVQFKMGGNIIPFLEEVVTMQREKLALQKEIQTLTASSRTTGYLLLGLVPAIVIILTLISPDYFSVFFKTSIGWNLFILAVVLEIVGFLWIYKILRIEY